MFSRRDPLELPRLAQPPAQATLIQMLAMAQKNKGKTVKVSWQKPSDPEVFTLDLVIADESAEPQCSPENRWSVGLEKSRSLEEYKEPRWTLSKETRPSEQQDISRLGERPVKLWSHAAGDVELILNLVLSQSGDLGRTKAAVLPQQCEKTTENRALTEPINPLLAAEASISDQNSRRPSVSTVENVFQSVSLAGKLSEMDLSGVFQSIMICKMTGCLNIQSNAYSSEIFFDEGVLTHARLESVLSQTSTQIKGDQALLNVLTWDEGTFIFQKERKTSERSVKRRLEGLLLEGASLRDYHKYLVSLGITEDSILIKRDPNLTEEQFDAKVQDGVPIDLTLQKKVYQALDGVRIAGPVFESLNLPKTVWTPILFNLVNCELVSLKTAAVANVTTTDLAIPIDQSTVKEAAKLLLRPETGLCSFPLATHFLEMEIARLDRCDKDLTVVVFELKYGKTALSNDALQQLADSVSPFKEKFDLLAHYKVFDFVMVLPLRTEGEAKEMMTKFYENATKWGLDGFTPNPELQGYFGIVSTKSAKTQAVALLVEAEKTKNRCKERGIPVLTGREMRWDCLFNDGLDLLRQQRYLDAEAALKSARDEAKTFGETDSRVLQSIQKLSEMYLEQQKYPQASELLEELLTLKEQTEGSESVGYAITAGELARACFLRGDYEQSENLLRDVIEVYKTVHGEDHLITANSLFNLATVYLVQKKFEKGTPLIKVVLEKKASLLGNDHPEVQQISQQYEALLKEQARESEAIVSGSFKAQDGVS